MNTEKLLWYVYIYISEREREEGKGGEEVSKREGERDYYVLDTIVGLGLQQWTKQPKIAVLMEFPFLCVCVGGGTDTNNKKVNKYSVTVLDSDMLQKNKVG